MKTVQQFPAWFAKQKLSGKLFIGCSGLVMLLCLCGLPIAVLSPPTQTPETMNVSSIQTSAFETAMAGINQTATTNAPTNTPEPTNIPLLPSATPTESIEILIDVYSILGKPVNEVEAIIGSTVLITPNDDHDDNLAGGEYRDYEIGKYSVFVAYDKNGIARVFQVLDGLSNENYSLTQWNQILPQFGVYINTPPERTAPLAIYWDNYNGYFIAVVGDPVWTVQIAEAAYHP